MLLNAARLLLIAPLLLAPWLLGSAEPHLNRWLVWPLAASALAWLAHAWKNSQLGACRVPTVAVLPLAGALLGLFQCLPIWNPDSSWAPGVAKLWGELGIVGPGDGVPGTLYAGGTVQQVAWLTLAALVATLAPVLYASRAAVGRVFGAIAINGALLATFMLIQSATWNGRIYWIGPRLDRYLPASGPFVYHNQAANSFALAIACLAGWWIATRVYDQPKATHSGDREARLLGGPRWLRVGQLLCGVVLAVGLVAAESRGAIVAACVTAGVGLLARLPRERIGRAAQIGIVTSAAVGAVVVWLAAGEATGKRYATLLEDQTLTEDTRLAAWKDAARASKAVGVLGGGLGTYGHTVQAFQKEPTPFEFRNAHNQYLEALVDGGPLALGLVVAAIAVSVISAFRAARSSRRMVGAVGLVALLVVVFQSAHAVVDFCLYLPAAFLPTALVVGLLGTIGSRHGASTTRQKTTPSPRRSGLAFGAIGLIMAAPLAAAVLHRVGTIDRQLVLLPLNSGKLEASDEELDQHLTDLDRVLAPGSLIDRLLPRDAVAYEALGDLRVVRYRRAARQAIAAELGIDPDEPSLSPWTNPSVLFRKAHEALQAGDLQKLEDLREQDLVLNHLVPAYEAYTNASEACPMLERAAVRRVELSFTQPRFEEEEHLENALAIAQQIGGMRPESLFAIGNLALLTDEPDQAWRAWRACLEISSKREAQIVTRAATAIPPDRLVEELLPRDPTRLVWIGSRVLAAPGFAIAQAATLGEAQRLLAMPSAVAEFGLRPGEKPALIASCRREAGDLPGAIAALEAALKENPARLDFRFTLAQLLNENGQLERALEEAQFCARAKPSNAGYNALARKLSRARLDSDRRGR